MNVLAVRIKSGILLFIFFLGKASPQPLSDREGHAVLEIREKCGKRKSLLFLCLLKKNNS